MRFLNRPIHAAHFLRFFGILWIIAGIWAWSAALEPKFWKVTPGILLSAEVTWQGGGGDGGETYAPEVHYRYEADGRSYEGTRYNAPTTSSGNREREWDKVEALLHRQSATGQIEVHFDPRNPGRSVLDTRVTPFGFLLLNLGLTCCCLAVTVSPPERRKAWPEYGRTGFGLSALCLGLPWTFLGWYVNRLLITAWIACLLGALVMKLGKQSRQCR